MPTAVYVLVMQKGLIDTTNQVNSNGLMTAKTKFVGQFTTLLSASGSEASTSMGTQINNATEPIYVIEYSDTNDIGGTTDHHFNAEIKIDTHYSLRTMLQGHGATATQFLYIAPTVSHQEWLKDAPAPVTGVRAAFKDATQATPATDSTPATEATPAAVMVTFTAPQSGQWSHIGSNTQGSPDEGIFTDSSFGNAYNAAGSKISTAYTDARNAKGRQRRGDWQSYGVDSEDVDYHIVIRRVHDRNSCGVKNETDLGRAFHAQGMKIGALQTKRLSDGSVDEDDNEKADRALTIAVVDAVPGDNSLYMLRDKVYEVFILTALKSNQAFTPTDDINYNYDVERLADLEGHGPGALIAVPKAAMSLNLEMWQKQYSHVTPPDADGDGTQDNANDNGFGDNVTVYAAGTMTHTTGYCVGDVTDVTIQLTNIEVSNDLTNWGSVDVSAANATSWAVADDSSSGDAIATLNKKTSTATSRAVYSPLAITLPNGKTNKYRGLRLTFTAKQDARLPTEGTYTEKTALTNVAADSGTGRMTQFVYFMPVAGAAHSHSVNATDTTTTFDGLTGTSEDHHKFTAASAKGAPLAGAGDGALSPWYVASISRALSRVAADTADTYDDANTGEMVRSFGTALDTVSEGSKQELAGMTAMDYNHVDDLKFTHNKVAMGQTSKLTSTIGKQLYPEPMFNSGLDNTYEGYQATWAPLMHAAATNAVAMIGSQEPIPRLVEVPTSDGTNVTVTANAAGHNMKAVTLIDLSSGKSPPAGAGDGAAYKTKNVTDRGDVNKPWEREIITVQDVLSGTSDYDASGLLILESRNARADSNTYRPHTGVTGSTNTVGVSIYFLDRTKSGSAITLKLDSDFGMKPIFADHDVHLSAKSIAKDVTNVGTRK